MKGSNTFIGGKLNLKNIKEDKTTKKIKKIMFKDTISKVMPIKGKTFIANIEGESELVRQIEERELEKQAQMNKANDFKDPHEYIDSRTAAEKRFYDMQVKRLPDKIERTIQTTFKEKYDKFSKNLSKIPEHYDIPKVGPG